MMGDPHLGKRWLVRLRATGETCVARVYAVDPIEQIAYAERDDGRLVRFSTAGRVVGELYRIAPESASYNDEAAPPEK